MTFKGICMNFLLELNKFILNYPVTSKQPHKMVQIHMGHPLNSVHIFLHPSSPLNKLPPFPLSVFLFSFSPFPHPGTFPYMYPYFTLNVLPLFRFFAFPPFLNTLFPFPFPTFPFPISPFRKTPFHLCSALKCIAYQSI